MSEYLFDYASQCVDGCGAQMVVPVGEIVRDDGTFCCPHCGKAYTISPENLRLLTGLLAKNFTSDEVEE